MSARRQELLVRLEDAHLGHADLGWLRRDGSAGKSVLSFEFDPTWLSEGPDVVLDPSLALYLGEQYLERLPGLFADTAPDRWGRTLLERRESILARREGRAPRRLEEWDFLLGVSDELRMGSLRFADSESGSYFSPSPRGVPPFTRLRVLQRCAERAERGERLDATDEDRELAMLIAPGSSLGGTRPKSNYEAQDGTLWIAKFPSRTDRRDMGAWEYVLHRLAVDAGVIVPESRLLDLGAQYRTFAVRRFDRVPAGRRLFASAMTLLSKQDHEAASYVEIADSIARFGSRDREEIDEDMAQMFRRVAFNVLTAHRDDHLRNHGFLMTRNGWRLAPAYDLNPVPELAEHQLALDESSPIPDIDVVRRTASYYRVRPARADEIIDELQEAVARWRTIARDEGIDRDEIDLMADGFRALTPSAEL